MNRRSFLTRCLQSAAMAAAAAWAPSAMRKVDSQPPQRCTVRTGLPSPQWRKFGDAGDRTSEFDLVWHQPSVAYGRSPAATAMDRVQELRRIAESLR